MMNKRLLQGFTLIEMIVVIVITGIIASAVAIFIRAPVQGYTDSARRAELTDIADTALRRVSRDLRTALPNSVRVTGACAAGPGPCYLEFIPTLGGGRYRAGTAGAAADVICPGGTDRDDILDFGAADTCFEVLGAMPVPPVTAGVDQIVVYNMGPGHLGADAYSGLGGANDNRRSVTAVGATSITLDSVNALPNTSCVYDVGGALVGGCRFHVVRTAVTYACDGAGNLLRWQGYAIPVGQPTALPVGGTSFTLATNVSDCRFAYGVGISQDNGLVTMHLSITEQGETVAMYAATHVSNVP
ncbi:MAG: prepilin-type N-terminal cleavage/methylation domain-containing protein [Sideroxydans sp.]|nr:prepilin-type N-terminal cleavage/methylation domain-containing protein [Sideroxydans sp.]